MEQRQILHIVHGSSRSRAEQARLGFELGQHCEVYADIGEFVERPPESGIVLVHDELDGETVQRTLDLLAGFGLWLPVVATSEDPRPGHVVAAVKAGALDYLRLPLIAERLAAMIERTAHEAVAYGEARRKMIEARNRIANLSPREREVLDSLAQGHSNKMIARELEISPRTVEIHRANMMAKLGASHSAQAVRLQLEAHLAVGNRAFG